MTTTTTTATTTTNAAHRLNTRFQVQDADRELLLRAAAERNQTVGTVARDLALAHLRGARTAESRLTTLAQTMSDSLNAMQQQLAALTDQLAARVH
jgi:hypothetical protein